MEIYMEVIYIILIIIGVTAQNVSKKAYNLRGGAGAGFTFSAGSVLCACLFFIISGGFKFDFNPAILPYALGFALFYGMAVIFSFFAIKYGSLSLTSLITSYSLIVPAFYGILFLNEPVSILLYLGLAALMISLFLVNYKPNKKDESRKKEKGRVDPRWFLFVALAFVGNGACSTVLTVHQKTFNGQYKSELMICALVMVFLTMATMALFTERKTAPAAIKKGYWLMAITGGFNGLVNLLVMICSLTMSASVMYPLISAGGIIGTALVSILFYKEKLTKMQYVGFVLGILAIVLLNI